MVILSPRLHNYCARIFTCRFTQFTMRAGRQPCLWTRGLRCDHHLRLVVAAWFLDLLLVHGSSLRDCYLCSCRVRGSPTFVLGCACAPGRGSAAGRFGLVPPLAVIARSSLRDTGCITAAYAIQWLTCNMLFDALRVYAAITMTRMHTPYHATRVQLRVHRLREHGGVRCANLV